MAGFTLADIIAVRGNPLDDIKRMENVVFVMKGGGVFKGPTAPPSGPPAAPARD
jgi:hypothetical protein